MADKITQDLFLVLAPMFGLEKSGVTALQLNLSKDLLPQLIVTQRIVEFQLPQEVTRKYDLTERVE